MTDKNVQVPTASGAPDAVVPPPSVGREIEQGMDKLGQSLHEAARDFGSAAGRAADRAAEKLVPMADQMAGKAQQHFDATVRDLDIAANTVQSGCAEAAQAAWHYISSGNFGLAGDAVKVTAGNCADSVHASLLALIPWMN